MTSSVLDLTDSSFGEEIAGSDLPVLVEFWAPWCGPCKAMAPILEGLAGEYDGRLRIGKVNADENLALAQRYDVGAVPALLVFHEGELVRKTTGARSRAQLLADLGDVIDGRRIS